MITSLTLDQFKVQYGATQKRKLLLAELEQFLANLTENFSSYRVLVYGSFISLKPEPGDIDVMVSVICSPKDAGFARFKNLQELATSNVDVFTLNLKSSFGATEPVPDAEAMVIAFNAREAHVTTGIHCSDAIEPVKGAVSQ